MSLTIRIITIPHKYQAYPTVGNWVWAEKDHLTIYVSEMNDWKKEIAVALHELVEVMLCRDRGITQEEVDKFDIDFEENRQEGNTDEPGDDPKAPYRKEHRFATHLEKLFCDELGLNWEEYEETINSL